jgi:hypothetical protein
LARRLSNIRPSPSPGEMATQLGPRTSSYSMQPPYAVKDCLVSNKHRWRNCFPPRQPSASVPTQFRRWAAPAI